jgi:hypothetical protein
LHGHPLMLSLAALTFVVTLPHLFVSVPNRDVETSRCRLTHANNYLIVESRRPCESVSTKPTVQHIGHPRNATRAATPAPKDSQGCAVWWTMAQASSAAAAAPRIRCAPRKALPNMPTPRK